MEPLQDCQPDCATCGDSRTNEKRCRSHIRQSWLTTWQIYFDKITTRYHFTVLRVSLHGLQLSPFMWFHNITSWRHNNCNSLRFNLRKFLDFWKQACRLHRCPADTNKCDWTAKELYRILWELEVISISVARYVSRS